MVGLLRFSLYILTMFSAQTMADTVVIDFNSIDNTSNLFSGDSLDIDGYNFSSSMPGNNAILHWGKYQSYNADQGGATYSHNYAGIISSLKKMMEVFLIFSQLILETFITPVYLNLILSKG